MFEQHRRPTNAPQENATPPQQALVDDTKKTISDFSNDIDAAVNQVIAGADQEEMVELLLARIPVHLREMAKVHFVDRLKRRQMEEEYARDPEAFKRKMQAQQQEQLENTRFSLTEAAKLIAKDTFEKIRNLFSRRPDVQQAVLQAGNVLLQNGVVPDRMKVREGELGELASVTTPNIGKEQEQTTTRR
jgi:hypothetical protein